MFNLFGYGVTEQRSERATEEGLQNAVPISAIRRGVMAREFLHKQGLAFAVATGVCAAVVQSDALGYTTVAMVAGGWLFNAWLVKRLYELGLRQVAVRFQFMCADKGGED
jgi:hypothetical protein